MLTLLRPAAAVAALLGLMAVRFLMSRLTPGFPRAQDLAKVSRPRAPRCLPGARTYSPARSNSHFKTLKRADSLDHAKHTRKKLDEVFREHPQFKALFDGLPGTAQQLKDKLRQAPVFVAHYGKEGELEFIPTIATNPDKYVDDLIKELGKP